MFPKLAQEPLRCFPAEHPRVHPPDNWQQRRAHHNDGDPHAAGSTCTIYIIKNFLDALQAHAMILFLVQASTTLHSQVPSIASPHHCASSFLVNFKCSPPCWKIV